MKKTGDAESLRVFLITQPYLDIEKEKGGVKGVKLQRISEREWLPLFYVDDGRGGSVICAIRTMDHEGVRMWDSLNLLCEWIRDHYEIYTVETSLTDVEIAYKGDERNGSDEAEI